MINIHGRHWGETIIVLGNGPSLKNVPVDFLKRFTTIGVNLSSLYYDATYLVWLDRGAILRRDYRAIIHQSKAEKFCPSREDSGRCEMVFVQDPELSAKTDGTIEAVAKNSLIEPKANHFNLYKPSDEDPPLSDDYEKGLLFTRSSIFPAINLAMLFGARRIVCAGLDLHDEHHFYKPFKGNIPDRPFRHTNVILTMFERIANQIRNMDLEILNLNPDSLVRFFPFVEIEEV